MLERLLSSILRIVFDVGYIVIPIEGINDELKRELKISQHKIGELVIVSRPWLNRGTETALRLGEKLQQETVLVEERNSLILYVVKAKPRKKWFGRIDQHIMIENG